MGSPLALFPLGTVLFPEMLMPLHVFEPRYRMLLRRSLEREEPFGVALIKSGVEVGGPADPHPVGTTARVVGATALPDGRSLIVCQGERRFAIESIDAEREPYLVATVRYLEEDDGADATVLADAAAEAFGEYLSGILAATHEPRSETPLNGLRTGSPREVSYRIAAALGIDAAERQRLLEARARAELSVRRGRPHGRPRRRRRCR